MANLIENTILNSEDELKMTDHEVCDINVISGESMQMLLHENSSSDLCNIENLEDNSIETGVYENDDCIEEEFILPTIEYGNNVTRDIIKNKIELESDELLTNLSPLMSVIGDYDSMEYLQIDDNISQKTDTQKSLTSAQTPTDHDIKIDSLKEVNRNIDTIDSVGSEQSKNLQSQNMKNCGKVINSSCEEVQTEDTLHSEYEMSNNITGKNVNDERYSKLSQEFVEKQENRIDSEFVDLNCTLVSNSIYNNCSDTNIQNGQKIDAGEQYPDLDPLMSNNIGCVSKQNFLNKDIKTDKYHTILENETPTITMDCLENESSKILGCLESELSHNVKLLECELNPPVTATAETKDISTSNEYPKIVHSKQIVNMLMENESSDILLLVSSESELSHNPKLLNNKQNSTAPLTVETGDISTSKHLNMVVGDKSSEILGCLESELSHGVGSLENEPNLSVTTTRETDNISNRVHEMAHKEQCNTTTVEKECLERGKESENGKLLASETKTILRAIEVTEDISTSNKCPNVAHSQKRDIIKIVETQEINTEIKISQRRSFQNETNCLEGKISILLDNGEKKKDSFEDIQVRDIEIVNNSKHNQSLPTIGMKVNIFEKVFNFEPDQLTGETCNVSSLDPLVGASDFEMTSNKACETNLSKHVSSSVLADENLNHSAPILIIDGPVIKDTEIKFNNLELLRSKHEMRFPNRFSKRRYKYKHDKNGKNSNTSLNKIMPKLPKVSLNNIDSLMQKMNMCRKLKVIINRIEDEYGKIIENKTYKLFNDRIIMKDDNDDDVEIIETPIECIEIDDDDESSTTCSNSVISDDCSESESFGEAVDSPDNVTPIDETSKFIDNNEYLDEITGAYKYNGKEVPIMNDDGDVISDQCIEKPTSNDITLHQDKQQVNEPAIFDNNEPSINVSNSTVDQKITEKSASYSITSINNNKVVEETHVRDLMTKKSSNNTISEHQTWKESVNKPDNNKVVSSNDVKESVPKPPMVIIIVDDNVVATNNVTDSDRVKNIGHVISKKTNELDTCINEDKSLNYANIKLNNENTSHHSKPNDTKNLVKVTNLENFSENFPRNNDICKVNEPFANNNPIISKLLKRNVDVDILKKANFEKVTSNASVSNTVSKKRACEENIINKSLHNTVNESPTYCDVDIVETIYVDDEDDISSSISEIDDDNFECRVVSKKSTSNVLKYKNANIGTIKNSNPSQQKRNKDKQIFLKGKKTNDICAPIFNNIPVVYDQKTTKEAIGDKRVHATSKFVCKICGLCLKDSVHLIIHETSHSESQISHLVNKPKQCDISHVSKSHCLAIHKNPMPKSAKPRYNCVFGLCTKSFVNLLCLRKHILTHTEPNSSNIPNAEFSKYPRIEILPISTNNVTPPSSSDKLVSASTSTRETGISSPPIVTQKKPRRKITVGNCSTRKAMIDTPMLEVELPIEVVIPSTTKSLRQQRTLNKKKSNKKIFLKCRPFPDLVNVENEQSNTATTVNSAIPALLSKIQPDLLNIPWHTPGATQRLGPHVNQLIQSVNSINNIPHLSEMTADYNQILHNSGPVIANYSRIPQQMLNNGRSEMVNAVNYGQIPHQALNSNQTEINNLEKNAEISQQRLNTIMPMNVLLVTPTAQNDTFSFINSNNPIRSHFGATEHVTQIQGERLLPSKDAIPLIRTIEVTERTLERTENKTASYHTNINQPAMCIVNNAPKLSKKTVAPSASIEDDIDNLLPVNIIFTDNEQNEKNKKKSIVSFRCDFCEMTFMSKAALSKHHSSPQRECLVCECSFCDEKALSRHMDIHSDKLPQKCNHCGKRYKELNHLIHHIHWAHSDFKYTCGMCFRTYRSENPPINNVVKIVNDTQTIATTVCDKCDIKNFDYRRIYPISHNQIKK